MTLMLSVFTYVVTVPVRLLTVSLSFRRFTSKSGCPHCGSVLDSERTTRPLLVKNLLFFLPLKAYKCMKCRKEHVRF